jgi:hypothetical protein
MGTLWPAVLEVSPSPVYGARLLSGLRVMPSRGFKSRHLRQLTASGPWVRGGHSHARKTCVIVQCTVMWTRDLLRAPGHGHHLACPEREKDLLHEFTYFQVNCRRPPGRRPVHGQRRRTGISGHLEEGAHSLHERHGVGPPLTRPRGSMRSESVSCRGLTPSPGSPSHSRAEIWSPRRTPL